MRCAKKMGETVDTPKNKSGIHLMWKTAAAFHSLPATYTQQRVTTAQTRETPQHDLLTVGGPGHGHHGPRAAAGLCLHPLNTPAVAARNERNTRNQRHQARVHRRRDRKDGLEAGCRGKGRRRGKHTTIWSRGLMQGTVTQG